MNISGLKKMMSSICKVKILILALTSYSCSQKKESGVTGAETSPYYHPSVSTTTSTVNTSSPKQVVKDLSLTEEVVLEIGTTKVTLPAGTVHELGTATLQSFAGSFVNTSSMRMVAEPLALTITKADASDFEVGDLYKNIIIEQSTISRSSAAKLVALFEENHKLATAVKTGMTQKVLSEFQSDTGGGSYKITFPVHLTRVGFTIAEATSGLLPSGYSTYTQVAKDPENIAVSTSTPDTVQLSWTGDPRFNSAYAVVFWADGEAEKYCSVDVVDTNAETAATITSSTTAADYTSSIAALLDGTNYTVKVCGLSGRSPVADASSGAIKAFSTPARASASLTNTPSDPSNTTALNISVAGTNVIEYQYAVLTNAASCSSATYSSWTLVATPITDAVAQGTGDTVRVCVLGKISESNVQLIPTEVSWTVDKTPPIFTSQTLAAPALDGYLSSADRALTTDILGALTATGHEAASTAYKVATSATTCDAALTYSTTHPTAASSDITVDGDYKICVKLTDAATNTTFGASSTFTVDTAIGFSAVSLTGDAADQYINLAESALGNNLVLDATGTGFNTSMYGLVTWATTCNASVTYSVSKPQNTNASFTTDQDYKVCVELSDLAGNKTYGSSSVIHLKKNLPTAASISLANAVSDTYLSIADHLLTSNLSTSAVGTYYNTLEYAVVTSATACSAVGVWGSVIPQANDAGVSSDGTTYHVCARFTDAAGNPADYASTEDFTFDGTAPTFTSIALANGASDGYINSAEILTGADLHAVAVSTGASSEAYSLVTSATTCDSALTYGGTIKVASDPILVSGSTYKICVKLVDLAGNWAYGLSSNFEVSTAVPDCTSISLANDALDGWINITEHALTSALSSTAATTLASPIKTYAVIPSASACDASAAFGAADVIPNADDASLADANSYKVCAKVVDSAANPAAYCATTAFTVDLTPPTFTSLPLANDAADGFVNISEHLVASDVVGPVSAAGYSAIGYALVTSVTACALPLTYTAPYPLQNHTTLNSSGTYKVCVQLFDTAGNSTYNSSPNFDSDQVAPTFTSLALANEAAGGYINLAESVSVLDSADSLVAAGQSLTEYASVTSVAACSSGIYGASVATVAGVAGLGDGSYKICAKLTDPSGNLTYGATSVVVVDMTPPSFSTASLANDAVDAYINFSEHSGSSALISAATGSGHDTVSYKLSSDAAACSGVVVWSGAIPASNSGDFGVDADYKVCVQLADYAGNPADYGSSSTIHLKTDFPIFTSLDLANDVVDLYLNASEHTNASALAANLTASGHASSGYVVVAAASTCNSSLTYGVMPLSNSVSISGAGNYKVCTSLTDVAGNITYGTTSSFEYDPTAPSFTSISLANDVLDSWLNNAEHSLTNNLAASLVASGYSTDQYAVVSSATTCDSGVVYGAMPLSDAAAITDAGTWKICVKLIDASGNISYGTGASTFQSDFGVPSFTSVALANDTSDGFINAADVLSSSNVTAVAVGSNHVTAFYVVATGGTTCDGNLTYGPIPKTDDSNFAADGSYKVCVKLTDTAGNAPAYGASSTFVKDVTKPTSAVTTSGSITPLTTAGSETQISGTATDPTSGVASVDISIQEASGLCYSIAANDFSAACPAWISAAGTISWTYNIPDAVLMIGVIYNIQVRATDLSVSGGNVQTSYGSGSFTYTATEGSDLWLSPYVYHHSGDDRPTNGAVDSSGNLFVVGWHTVSDKNWMIKKFDKRGNEDITIWNKDVGDIGSDEIARGVALDSSNNLYVVGSRHNGSNLDWWLKAYNSSGVEDATNWDIILDGNSGNDEAMGVAVDTSSNVYVVGYGTNIAGATTGEDIWIRKYSSLGVLSCEQKIDGGAASLSDRALSVAVNSATSKLYVAGYQTVVGGDQQMVIRRLRTSDCTVEVTAIGNSAGTSDQAATVKLDSSGVVYLAGRDSSTDSDWWLKKYSAALVQQAEFNTGVASTHDALAVAVDSSNNVYAGGYKTGATQDWWLRQFTSSLVEDTANWDKVIDAAGGADQITSIVIGTGTNDVGSVYVIGWGTNISGGATGADWWILKYAN